LTQRPGRPGAAVAHDRAIAHIRASFFATPGIRIRCIPGGVGALPHAKIACGGASSAALQ